MMEREDTPLGQRLVSTNIEWDRYAALVKKSRIEQGLPAKLVDPVVLRNIALFLQQRL